ACPSTLALVGRGVASPAAHRRPTKSPAVIVGRDERSECDIDRAGGGSYGRPGRRTRLRLDAYMDSSRLQAFCRLWLLGTTAHVYPTSVVERICSGLDGLFARRRLIDLSCLGALRNKQAVPTSVRPVSHPRLGLRNRR